MTIFSRKYVPALGLTFKAAASRRLFWWHRSFLVHTSTSETHFSDNQPLALSAVTASIEEAHEETSGAPHHILAWSPQGPWCSLCWPVLLPCSLNGAAVEEQACGSPHLLAAPASYLKVCKKGRACAPPPRPPPDLQTEKLGDSETCLRLATPGLFGESLGLISCSLTVLAPSVSAGPTCRPGSRHTPSDVKHSVPRSLSMAVIAPGSCAFALRVGGHLHIIWLDIRGRRQRGLFFLVVQACPCPLPLPPSLRLWLSSEQIRAPGEFSGQSLQFPTWKPSQAV